MSGVTSAGDSEHLGIPKAVFVEDVDSFMQQAENDSTDTVIRRWDCFIAGNIATDPRCFF